MREIHEAWKEIMEIYKEIEQYNEQENAELVNVLE